MNESIFIKILQDTFADGTDSFLPHVAINFVVFGYDHPNLKVMTGRLKSHDFWSLPGGYIKKEEHLDDAAYRNLKLSGIQKVYLKQIHTFGDAFRVTELSKPSNKISPEMLDIMKWVSQRFVSVVYYGLVDFKTTKLAKVNFPFEYQWSKVYELNKMIQDHAKIIDETRKILINELYNYPVILNLLPDSFTMNELRGLYEAILNRQIDRGTFRRKILKQGLLEQVDKRKDSTGRPSHLFRFNQNAYLRFLAEETKFGF